MTNREFFTAIINNEVNDEVIAKAKAEIATLDARNDKRRNTPTKEQIANEAIKGDILNFLAGKKDVLASEIATALGLSTQKVSALCKQMVEAEVLAVADVKVKGKGTVKGYAVKA